MSSPTLIAPPVGSRPASQQPQPDGVPSYESSAPGLAVWSAGGGPPMSGHLTVVAAGLLLLIVISATVVGLFVGRRYIGRLLIGRRRQQQQQHQHHRRPSSSSVCSLPSTIVNGRTRGVGAVAANGMATASGIGGQAVTSWLLVDQMQQSTGGSGSRGSGGSGAAVSLFDRVSAVVARNENYWSELTMTGIVDSTGVPSPIVFGCGSGSGSGTLIGIGGGVAVPVLPTQTIVQQNLTLLDEIGEGAFGKVYKGEFRGLN